MIHIHVHDGARLLAPMITNPTIIAEEHMHASMDGVAKKKILSHLHDVGVHRAVHDHPGPPPELGVRRNVDEDRLLVLHEGVDDESSVLEHLGAMAMATATAMAEWQRLRQK